MPPTHGGTEHASTSGSTGHPLSVLKTGRHQLFWAANLLRDLLWYRFDFGSKMAVIRRDLQGDPGPGKGRRLPDWGPDTVGVFPTGPAALFDVRKSLHEQAAWLQRENPEYLLSFTSNLALLAQHFRDTGVKLTRLRALRSFAEALSPDLRELCREVFGVGITDSYSSEEIGYIALQCPSNEHLHVLSESVLLEVVDEAGRACVPGQVGRVVVTPLHNFAMPLFRYELGDLAEPGPPCDCGRTLPVLRRVLGRTRNRVLLPNGESRFAYFGGKKLNTLPFLRQCQVVQKTRTDIELNLVVRRAPSAEEEAHVIKIIRDALDYPFDVRIVYVDAIPRATSGKFEDFKSEAV